MSTTPPADAAIELVAAEKKFGRQVVVDQLSLRIPRGTAFGLLGPNGAGKTTTIKALVGLLPLTRGQACVLGRDVRVDPLGVKRRIGYVPEAPSVYRWMRVREAVQFCERFYPTWNNRRCAEQLALFELDPGTKVKHLSKGMAAKLALVLAGAHEPEVMILDEPMGGLDPVAREEFLAGVLRALGEGRQTILFCSHMLSDVQRIVDRIGILYEGRLLVDSPVDKLLTETKRIRAVLRDGAEPPSAPAGTIHQLRHGREWLLTVSNFVPEVVQALRSAEGLEHVEVSDIGLEEIFKDYVKGREELRMKALLWKDARHHVPVLIAAGLMLTAPLLIGVLMRLVKPLVSGATAVSSPSWHETIQFASGATAVLSLLIAALLGGYAMAGERQDRSAEFLAVLPVSRIKILSSKVIFALVTGTAIGVIVVLCVWFGQWLEFQVLAEYGWDSRFDRYEHLVSNVRAFSAIAAVMFGTAWLFSSFMTSPTYATCAGIVAPVLLYVSIGMWQWVAEEPQPAAGSGSPTAYLLWCLLLGVSGFVAGVVIYLRRKTP